jgi:hypothetical protein
MILSFARPWPLTLLLTALASAQPAFSAPCLDFHQSLPAVIGHEERSDTFRFVLKCDTVFVRKGVTTVVHPGTLIHFAQPSLNSVIKVEGTLIIKGTKNAYAYLAGSADTSKPGVVEPGARQWGGIEVAEGGRLEMEYAGVMRAPTPITAFSPQVKIVNSFFKGSSGIILPDGNLMPLEIKWHAINNLDLEKGRGDRHVANADAGGPKRLSEDEKKALLAKPQGFWTWKKATGTLVGLALVGVGAIYLGGGEDTPAGVPGPGPADKGDGFDPPPSFDDLK